PFEGEIDPDAVLAIADRCLRAGYTEIAVADTIGVGVPAQVRALVDGVRDLPGGGALSLRAHFHNTRNTGYANAVAAVEAGVTALDASLGGIGGCPFAPNATGNIASEDLDYLLARSGYETDLDLHGLAVTGARWSALFPGLAPSEQSVVDAVASQGPPVGEVDVVVEDAGPADVGTPAVRRRWRLVLHRVEGVPGVPGGRVVSVVGTLAA